MRQCAMAIVLMLSVALSGCKHSTEIMGKQTVTFPIKGTILAVGHKEVTLQHDAVPGFMEAMTMPYKLAHDEAASELHVGDVIRARLLVEKSPDGDYHNARLDEIVILAQAKPNFKPSSDYHVPTAGDVVPDVALVDQDGKVLHLNRFHGKALLVTFIYTRCPMNDFCPKMSRNFAAIDKSLRADPALQDHTHLLSISFDPEFDSPAVLRAYGKQYTGDTGFDHWQFVAPLQVKGDGGKSLTKMEHFFNVGVTPPEGADSLTHSLSTVLIDPAGKIAAWYPGSEWSPDEVVAKMKSLTPTA